MDRAESRVSCNDGVQEALQCLTELHGFRQRELHSISIETVEGVVNDNTRLTCPLRNDTDGVYDKV
jgi:hypothetical protein